MHELPVTENILEIALRHAEQADATRINDIYIVIGRLSSIIDDSIQFYWDIVSKDTIAEGASLHFKRIEPKLECQECGQKYTPEGMMMPCPNCGSARIKVLTGNEFYLESIQVEKAEARDPQESKEET
jgi:hydrogenase nickel incorporation protein HypA/HybF